MIFGGNILWITNKLPEMRIFKWYKATEEYDSDGYYLFISIRITTAGETSLPARNNIMMSRKGGEIWHAVIVRVLFFEIIIIFTPKRCKLFPRDRVWGRRKKKKKKTEKWSLRQRHWVAHTLYTRETSEGVSPNSGVGWFIGQRPIGRFIESEKQHAQHKQTVYLRHRWHRDVSCGAKTVGRANVSHCSYTAKQTSRGCLSVRLIRRRPGRAYPLGFSPRLQTKLLTSRSRLLYAVAKNVRTFNINTRYNTS